MDKSASPQSKVWFGPTILAFLFLVLGLLAVAAAKCVRYLQAPGEYMVLTCCCRWFGSADDHASAIAAMDFFVVLTATFRVLYVVVVMYHARRKVVHFNITDSPTAAWTAQQIVNAFPYDAAPKYLLWDRTGFTIPAISTTD